MDIESKMELIKSEPTEEIITDKDMRALLETNQSPKHYFGLEISGMPHIGHILVAGKKINDMNKAGVRTQVLLADWHTVANNKLGGNWEKIFKASKFYRELFNTVCPDTKVVLGSDLYKNNDDYWKLVVQIARRTTIARATRTLIIQGRSEKDTLHVSQYIYPIMQVADISMLDVDIPHAGMDQRRVHVLAKELFDDLSMKKIVPIHHHLLPSLAEPPKITDNTQKEEIVATMRMSKSKKGSAIPILADEDEVSSILKTSWCPEGVIDGNPVLLLCKYVIIPSLGELNVERDAKYGGDANYTTYLSIESDFASRKLHPVDLKNAVARSISRITEPIVQKFGHRKQELLELFA